MCQGHMHSENLHIEKVKQGSSLFRLKLYILEYFIYTGNKTDKLQIVYGWTK